MGPRSLADFSSTSDRNVELNDMSVTLLTSLFVLEFTFCTNRLFLESLLTYYRYASGFCLFHLAACLWCEVTVS